MSIWIKSQDGGLGEYSYISPPCIYYKTIPDPECPFNNIPIKEVVRVQIFGSVANNVNLLGTYPTEAEALAVLDMIQDAVYFANYVFRMPPAGFKEGE